MEHVRPWKLYLARGLLNLGFVEGLMQTQQLDSRNEPVTFPAHQLPDKAGAGLGSSAASRPFALAISSAIV